MLRTNTQHRGPLGWILGLFSNVWLGITWLTLILIYAAVMSAVIPVRRELELTEMAAFRHWVFGTLIVLFCATLITTTIRRVRWNITNLGTLIVHSGLLLLAGGSAWYFGTKIEGDTQLLAPRIALVSTAGQRANLPEFAASTGSSWGSFMPVLGGEVRFTVVNTNGSGVNVVDEATVRIEIPGQSPREIKLNALHAPQVNVNERFALRLVTFPPETHFYDNEGAALYVHPRDTPYQQIRARPLPGLPIYRERYLPGEEGTLVDRRDQPLPSKRNRPEMSLFGLTIPTGWFESWRMPIDVDARDLPFDIQVTGYVPYIAGLQPTAIPGGAAVNPAIRLRIETPGEPLAVSLFANDPKNSLLATELPIELRWVADDGEREELLAGRAGGHELEITVKDPPIQQTVAVQAGQTIQVPGTPYELKVVELIESWPLMSPGYEGVMSPVARIDVNNGQFAYNRTVVQRFDRTAPFLTQDIDTNGKRSREPLDANLVLRYRSSPTGWITIVAGPREDSPVELGLFDDAGKVHRYRLAVGAATPIGDLGSTKFFVTSVLERAQARLLPVLEPRDVRRPLSGREMSAVRLKLTGRDALAGWSETRWCGCSFYPNRPEQPLEIRTPDGRDWEIIYSRLQRELGGGLALRRLKVNFFPGRADEESWHSFVVGRTADGRDVDGEVFTNRTWSFGDWMLHQANAPRDDDWSWTGLGVGNRNGMWPMMLGCILVPVGCLYAFYVKPILRRRAAQRALAALPNRAAADVLLPTNGQPQRAKVEV